MTGTAAVFERSGIGIGTVCGEAAGVVQKVEHCHAADNEVSQKAEKIRNIAEQEKAHDS